MVQVRGRKLLVAGLLLLIAVSSCTTTGGTFCDIAKPIRPSETTIAAMSDTEINAALAHNRKGQKLCGWVP